MSGIGDSGDSQDSEASAIRLARHAMATRFEIVLQGDDPMNLRAAGEEALDEIERWEARLSLYRPDSEIAELNARAADAPVRVTPPLLRLLARAKEIHRLTAGAFDVTIAPLMEAWGFIGGEGHAPDPERLSEARAVIGMDLVRIDEANSTVRYERKGVRIDLGSLGKGYALEQAALVLVENGVTRALLHGGTSSVIAIGSPSGESDGWRVALRHPLLQDESMMPVRLKNASLAVSGVRGKFFESGGERFGHVMGPRRGAPTSGALMAGVIAPSSADADALSTALLVLGDADALSERWPELPTCLALEDDESDTGWRLATRNWPEA